MGRVLAGLPADVGGGGSRRVRRRGAAARLDEYGIQAQVLYPNLLAFNLFEFFEVGDEQFRLACVQAYNDYLTEFSAEAPGRFVPISVLPFWDVEETVREIERCHDAGHGGLLFANSPEMINLPPFRDSHWDPVYATAQERHMSLNFHIGFGGFDSTMGVSTFPSRARRATTEGAEELGQFRADLSKVTTLGLISNARAIVEVLVSGICDRFPTLNFVSVESGFGYVPYLIHALDWQWLNNGAQEAYPNRLMPSEYFKRQVYATFWFEGPTVTRLIDLFADNVMFESDFPHPTSLSPGPVSHTDSPDKVIEANLADVPEDILTKILNTNADTRLQPRHCTHRTHMNTTPGTATVIGEFDPFHVGHRQLIEAATRVADRLGAPLRPLLLDRGESGSVDHGR